MALYVEEKWVDRTDGYRLGESGLYEPWTDDLKKLFKAYQKEHGRCTSKIYVDNNDGTKAIGWVFQKSEKYTDTGESYIKETWVVLHDEMPETRTTYHYHQLKGT